MSEQNADWENDLAVCELMAGEFEAYLRSDTLYWQMNAARPGGSQLPKLTVGGFLERVRRLRAAPLSTAQQARLQQAWDRFDHARRSLPDRYVSRVSHDLRGQLDAWAWYLDDYKANPGQQAAYYPSQAHKRLAIDLLLDESQDAPNATAAGPRIKDMDQRLRSDWIDGPFIWNPALAHDFPRDRFWWLHGRLVEPR